MDSGTFSKIEPKIRKISQLQSAAEIALVDEFHRNLRQMKGLGLVFQKKKILFSLIFRCFIHIWTSTRSGFSKKSKNTGFGQILSFHTGRRNNFFKNFFRKTVSPKPNLKNVRIKFKISALDQKLWLRTWPQIFENPDFDPKSYIFEYENCY